MRRIRKKDGMRACAYVVGEGTGSVLKDSARQAGFDSVYSYRGVLAAERQAAKTPLIFFLFSPVETLKTLKSVIEAVRASEVPQLRFAPMIYFVESPSLEVIKSCINMGFDDIISLPFTLNRVVQRLSLQVDRTLVYFETPTYFGPDRRNRLEHEEGHARRGTGGQFRRMEIVRTTTAGINVVKDETHVVML